jgi:hypothetical protein
MKTVFTAIGVLVVGFIGLIILVAVFSSGRTHNGTDFGSDTSPASPTPYTVTIGGTVFRGAFASNVGVAVLGAASQPFILTDLGTSQADGKYVIVRIAVSNQQSSEITMNDSLFELASPDGTVYSSSSKSMEVGERNNLFLASINPGLTKQGVVIFDVPATLELDSLEFRFRGGMTGETGHLPLTVQSTDIPRAPIAPTNEDNEHQISPTVEPEQPSSTQPVEPQQSAAPSDTTTPN